MNNVTTSIIVEILKLRRSKILLITLLLFMFIPIMMALLMLLAQHPEMMEKMGIVGTKASFFAANNWAAFFNLINQLIAVIGLIGFGFVISWIYGREHLEHTLTGIIALPIKRRTIVSAKFIVALMWCSLLILAMYFTGIVAGKAFNMQGWSSEAFQSFTKVYFITAYLSFAISTPIAFIACWSRGIIAPIGFVIMTMILAQIIAMIGLGPLFPWSIPGIATIPVKSPGYELTTASYIIVAVTFISGIWGTIAWWNQADHV